MNKFLRYPITFHGIRQHMQNVQADFPELKTNIQKRIVAAAIISLEHFLGTDWTNEHIKTPTPNEFLIPLIGDKGNRDIGKGNRRIINLAECLLSMQRVEGLIYRINDLKNKDLQGCISELQGAILLVGAGIPFRFLKETGVKKNKTQGGDFDVTALVNDVKVNCEMKSKCEGTEPDQNSLRNRLKQASKQLPKNEPNIVFVRLPETWMNSHEAREEVKQGITGYFRDSTRATSVIVHWEEWTLFDGVQGFGDAYNKPYLQQVNYRQFVNPNTQSPLHELPQLIEFWINAKLSNWFFLERAVCTDEEFNKIKNLYQFLQIAKMSMSGPAFRFFPNDTFLNPQQ
jgi:hypothetical protein